MGDDLNFDSWELLSPYVDGELDAVAAAQVERDVLLDPELTVALDMLRRQKAALQWWARRVDAKPIPPIIRTMLDNAQRCRCGNDDCHGEQHCPD